MSLCFLGYVANIQIRHAENCTLSPVSSVVRCIGVSVSIKKTNDWLIYPATISIARLSPTRGLNIKQVWSVRTVAKATEAQAHAYINNDRVLKSLHRRKAPRVYQGQVFRSKSFTLPSQCWILLPNPNPKP